MTGSVMRMDPGTMGRTLLHFRSPPRDGRHGLAYVEMDDRLITADLPPLPVQCALVRAARTAMAAGRVPDLCALVPLHLGLAFILPPVEVRPGDREIRLDFGASE